MNPIAASQSGKSIKRENLKKFSGGGPKMSRSIGSLMKKFAENAKITTLAKVVPTE